MRKKIVVGVSGASGSIYAVRLLELLHPLAEVHLVISRAALTVLGLETEYGAKEISGLAHRVYDNEDFCAPIASGSFPIDAMIVIPCSIKTLSAIANCHCDTLISRAADVALKEKRRLILSVRETPLHLGHLKLMSIAAESGAVISPPVPQFYIKPQSVNDIVTQTVCRILDLLDIKSEFSVRWSGSCITVKNHEPSVANAYKTEVINESDIAKSIASGRL
ncbi:MAG: UbiX family flavin prenyltransferase [Chitinispirillales bacterium]|jgi:4-hydroxy-3-polyprenylbenzoate decarboxylase|nr:UbiX family flavin prenyltransferase [Chitinispirillales bacterium]